MRTAITVAKTHAGKWQLLATPDDPLIEQKQVFRALRADKAHKVFSLVIYQESDGQIETIRMLTPHQKEDQEKARTKEQSESEAYDKSQKGKPDEAKAAVAKAYETATERALAVEAYAKENHVSILEAEKVFDDKEQPAKADKTEK